MASTCWGDLCGWSEGIAEETINWKVRRAPSNEDNWQVYNRIPVNVHSPGWCLVERTNQPKAGRLRPGATHVWEQPILQSAPSKTRSWINACVLTVSTQPALGALARRAWEWSGGLGEPGCIWLLHYRPFHWLGCSELMNWGSGQEHIIGRNEFLSQPSQEAAGPGWSPQRP